MKITLRIERFSQRVKKIIVASLVLMSSASMAQTKDAINDNPYVKMGQKALVDGDFKAAVSHLKKALPSDPGNATIMYTIGYSEFQLGNYKEAENYFSKVIDIAPTKSSAYYYLGMSQSTQAVSPENMSDMKRAALLESSINAFDKAIEIDKDDLKSYQNRGIAYRDLGNLLGTPSSKNHNKKAATDAYNNSIRDLKIVVAKNPNRKDLALELKKSTIYRDNLK